MLQYKLVKPKVAIPEVTYEDYLKGMEKQVNRLVMKKITEFRNDCERYGFDKLDYCELKALILNMYYLDIEPDYEDLRFKINIVLKLRPKPLDYYNKHNCLNCELSIV